MEQKKYHTIMLYLRAMLATFFTYMAISVASYKFTSSFHARDFLPIITSTSSHTLKTANKLELGSNIIAGSFSGWGKWSLCAAGRRNFNGAWLSSYHYRDCKDDDELRDEEDEEDSKDGKDESNHKDAKRGKAAPVHRKVAIKELVSEKQLVRMNQLAGQSLGRRDIALTGSMVSVTDSMVDPIDQLLQPIPPPAQLFSSLGQAKARDQAAAVGALRQKRMRRRGGEKADLHNSEKQDIKDNHQAEHLNSSGEATVATDGGYEERSLAVFFLQHELQMSQAELSHIVLRQPWLTYLRVDSNLRPTVDVLRSFGFRDRDVRRIVAQAPSVLAINHEWTLPEKLLSLQRMFNLNRMNLVSVLVAQPFLLTSSVARNMEVAAWLRGNEAAGGPALSDDLMRALLLKSPRVAMTSLPLLRRCWQALTDPELYGLSVAEARRCCVRYPALLSRLLLRSLDARLSFFGVHLQLDMVAVRRLALRFPPVLYLDTDYFLRNNTAELAGWLDCVENPQLQLLEETSGPGKTAADMHSSSYSDEFLRTVCLYPQLLGYNPTTLRRLCSDAMLLLTSEHIAPGRKLGSGDPSSGDPSSGSSWHKTVPFRRDGGSSGGGSSGGSSSGGGSSGGGSGTGSMGKGQVVYPNHWKDYLTDDADEGGTIDTASICVDSTWLFERHSDSEGSENPVSLATPAGVISEWRHFALQEASTEQIVQLDWLRTFQLSHSISGSDSEKSGGGAAVLEVDEELLKGLQGLKGLGHLRVLAAAGASLRLERSRALRTLRIAPGILSYRTARSQQLMAVLAVSLGLTTMELSRCVATYPRSGMESGICITCFVFFKSLG